MAHSSTQASKHCSFRHASKRYPACSSPQASTFWLTNDQTPPHSSTQTSEHIPTHEWAHSNIAIKQKSGKQASTFQLSSEYRLAGSST